jgi:RimJ/RimL family protein N-acetyltransferase
VGDAPAPVTLRPLTIADRTAYRDLRLRALREEPEAFTSSYDEEAATAERWSAERLAMHPDDNVIVGAFDGDGRLVGIAGVERRTRAKERHKALLYGMYVAPEAAGQGIGRRLVAAVIVVAGQWPGVRQITLTVTRGNERARRLYVAAGFATFGIEVDAIRIGSACFDKEHMVLRLASDR